MSAWRVDDVWMVADRFTSYGESVLALCREFRDNDALADAWRGLAGTAAMARAERLADDIANLSRMMAETSESVRRIAGQLAGARADLLAARAQVEAAGGWLHEDGGVGYPSYVEPVDPDPLVRREAERAYGAKVAAAGAAGRRAQDALARAAAGDVALRDAVRLVLLESERRVGRGWVMNEALLLDTGHYDPAVDAARARLSDLLGNPGDSRDRLRALALSLRAMTKDVLAEFFDSLTDEQAAGLSHLLAEGHHDGGFPWDRWHVGLSGDERLALLDFLKVTLDLDTLRQLRERMPVLETNRYKAGSEPGDGQLSLSWQDLAAPPFHHGDRPIDLLRDVNQGAIGDCWFLSALNAIAHTNPSMLTKLVRHNPNGTYTISFFAKGQWRPVTILPDVPFLAGQPYYAAQGSAGRPPVSWPALFEKAYAQLRGGYGGISGGLPRTAFTSLLGPTAQPGVVRVFPWGPEGFEGLKRDLADGHAVTADSKESTDRFLDPAGTIAHSHAYTVLDVDLKSKTVTLLNPWGDNAMTRQVVSVTYDEFAKYFDKIETVKVPT